MDVIAAMIVAQHVDQLQREAEANRRAKLVKAARPSRDGQVRARLAGVLRRAAASLEGGRPAVRSTDTHAATA